MDFTYLKNFMDFMAKEKTPGNAVEVYLGGERVFSYASGYSSLEEKTPLTGDEYFNIYSCSKVATVTAGMQVLEQGGFLITDPLYDYIPEYKEMYIKDSNGSLKKAEKPITVGDLFSMTAGLNYDVNSPSIKKARELTNGKMETSVVARCLAEEPLSFEPGTHWQYSLCHDVLAGLIEIVSGMKFRDYMKKNIFEPLGMDKTVYHATDKIKARMSEQYRFVPNDFEGEFDAVKAQRSGNEKEGYFINIGKDVGYIFGEEYDSGGAGITTTTEDYAKFVAALANYGLGVNGERILTKYSIDLMRINRLNEEAMKNFSWRQHIGYGYGLGVRTHINPNLSGGLSNLGEFGWGGAAGATVIVDPKINLGIFYTQHCMNPREEFYQPRLRNVTYAGL